MPAVVRVPKKSKPDPPKPATPPKPTPVLLHVVFQPQPMKMHDPVPQIFIDAFTPVGWDQGLLGMCVGEKCSFKIPSKRGYGERSSPPKIPGVPIFNLMLWWGIPDILRPLRNSVVYIESSKLESSSAKQTESEDSYSFSSPQSRVSIR
ncbi:peptidyl-prolyl cis-trans isomerase FKBP15-1 [Tanacetum coccineum]